MRSSLRARKKSGCNGQAVGGGINGMVTYGIHASFLQAGGSYKR